MPQVSVPMPEEGANLENIDSIPDPVLDDNFDLQRIDASEAVCRAIAPIIRTLQLTLADMSYVDNGAQYLETNGHRGALTLEFYNNISGQEWIDGCAALIAELDSIQFNVYDANGDVYSELVFHTLTEPEFSRAFHGDEGQVQVLQYVWLFAGVKETVKEAQ